MRIPYPRGRGASIDNTQAHKRGVGRVSIPVDIEHKANCKNHKEQ